MRGTNIDALERLRRVDGLVSRYGVVHDTFEPVWPEGIGDVQLVGADVGSAKLGSGRQRDRHIFGRGVNMDDAELARLVAIVEGAERYSGGDFLGEERIWASASGLAGHCLEPDRYPRCSISESSSESFPLRPFDSTASIRWARGWDLVHKTPVWVPAVMACYGLDPLCEAERFVYRISTGYAAHTDMAEAIVRGICEVIERDAIALTWLQRLPLPPLHMSRHTDALKGIMDWYNRRFMRLQVFDATTDLGVPTAYCVVSSENDTLASRFVGAGTGRRLEEAAEKAAMETVGIEETIHSGDPLTELDEVSSNIGDTSRYMASSEHSHAFDFLTECTDRPYSYGREPLPEKPIEALNALVSMLDAAGMQVAVVDRTPDELHEVGLIAVNVVIPDLQPMSLDPRIRFAGNERLFEAPKRMGFRTLSEEELNPWPQPFA